MQRREGRAPENAATMTRLELYRELPTQPLSTGKGGKKRDATVSE